MKKVLMIVSLTLTLILFIVTNSFAAGEGAENKNSDLLFFAAPASRYFKGEGSYTDSQKSGLALATTGSGYFHSASKYNDAVKEAVKTGDYSKIAQIGMNLQQSIDVAAYEPAETAKIVGQASEACCIDEALNRPSSTTMLLKKMFLMQQVQIAQNKVIIRLLTEVAHPKRSAASEKNE
jgi:hypothetical protein